MTIDRNSRMYATQDDINVVTPCAKCKHKRTGQTVYIDDMPYLTCDAFPNGVPREITRGDHDHKTPYPGDHGIMFEAKDA